MVTGIQKYQKVCYIPGCSRLEVTISRIDEKLMSYEDDKPKFDYIIDSIIKLLTYDIEHKSRTYAEAINMLNNMGYNVTFRTVTESTCPFSILFPLK